MYMQNRAPSGQPSVRVWAEVVENLAFTFTNARAKDLLKLSL